MLSGIPVDFAKLKKEELNKEILRVAIIAELDAINLYEQLAALTDRQDIKAVFLDIAKEERPTWGNFRPCCSGKTRNRSRNWPTARKKWRS